MKKSLTTFWTLVLFLLLTGNRCNDSTITTEVDAQEKISDSQGGFDGNLNDGDQFGSAIASIGDLEGDGVDDLAVGAPFDDDNGENRGAVWILFMDSDGRVDLERKISDDEGGFNGNLDNDDLFGSAIASIGDVDNDGVTDFAVGAPRDDDGGNNKGAVWVLFMDNDGTVKTLQKISSTEGNFDGNLNSDDRFGSAVAGIGDLNGDGVNDLAVGANQDDDGGSDRGAVWILLMNTDGTVNSNQKISHNRGEFNGELDDGDHFGGAVASIGDLDEDGVTELAVGAPGDDDGGQDRGATWILFMDNNGEVRSETKLSSENNFEGNLSDGDQFGSAIADIRDLDGDGVRDLMPGAPLDDDGGTDRGAVWVLFMQRVKTDLNFFGQ